MSENKKKNNGKEKTYLNPIPAPISKREEIKEETEGAEERGVKKETSSEGKESRREERELYEKESFSVSNPGGEKHKRKFKEKKKKCS